MPIDTSIYQLSKPVQQTEQQPSLLDSMHKAYGVAGMANQLRTQQSMRDAYAKNTDPSTGQLNQGGFISDIGKDNPQAAIQMQNTMAEAGKLQAEAQTAKLNAANATLDITMPKMQYLASMSPDDRAKAFNPVMQDLKAQGVPMQNVPQTSDGQFIHDEDMFQRRFGEMKQTKAYLATQLQKAEINRANVEAGQGPIKVGAEELGKFKDDVANASSRKTTGALIDSRNRADRVQNLVGRQKGENDQQYYARLDKLMPQIGTEVAASLAAVMQGGVPGETIQEKLAPDTMQSKIAELKQRYTAEPTPANQGKLLAGYADVAKKLGDFTSDKLKEATDQIRPAYPYANKYFAKEMDKIAEPIYSRGSAGQPQGNAPLVLTAAHDSAAKDWLKQNPNDPTAARVRAGLKARGVL